MLQADDVVREIGHQNSEHHVELEKTNQAATQFCRGNFRDVHGPEHRGAANAQSADKSEHDQGMPVPGEGAAQSGDEI